MKRKQRSNSNTKPAKSRVGNKSKSAFTLIELLVAIACGAILLASVTLSSYLLFRLNDEVVQSSSLNYKLSTLSDAVRQNVTSASDEDGFRYDDEAESLYFNDKLILDGVQVKSGGGFLYEEGGFLYFRLLFEDEKNREKEVRILIGPVSS